MGTPITAIVGQFSPTAARCPALSSPSARPLTMTAPARARPRPMSSAARRPYSVGFRVPTIPTAAGSLSQRGRRCSRAPAAYRRCGRRPADSPDRHRVGCGCAGPRTAAQRPGSARVCYPAGRRAGRRQVRQRRQRHRCLGPPMPPAPRRRRPARLRPADCPRPASPPARASTGRAGAGSGGKGSAALPGPRHRLSSRKCQSRMLPAMPAFRLSTRSVMGMRTVPVQAAMVSSVRP